MEGLNCRASVGIGESHCRVEAVDGGSVGDADSPRAERRAIGSERAQVHIEGAILLQQKEDVLDDA